MLPLQVTHELHVINYTLLSCQYTIVHHIFLVKMYTINLSIPRSDQNTASNN
jgi:hypothetical protein